MGGFLSAVLVQASQRGMGAGCQPKNKHNHVGNSRGAASHLGHRVGKKSGHDEPFLQAWLPGARQIQRVTLPPTNMEPDMGVLDDHFPFKGTSYQVAC